MQIVRVWSERSALLHCVRTTTPHQLKFLIAAEPSSDSSQHSDMWGKWRFSAFDDCVTEADPGGCGCDARAPSPNAPSFKCLSRECRHRCINTGVRVRLALTWKKLKTNNFPQLNHLRAELGLRGAPECTKVALAHAEQIHSEARWPQMKEVIKKRPRLIHPLVLGAKTKK